MYEGKLLGITEKYLSVRHNEVFPSDEHTQSQSRKKLIFIIDD